MSRRYGTVGLELAIATFCQHESEQLRLKSCIVQRVMAGCVMGAEPSCHLRRFSFLPATPGKPHVIRLHIDCGEPKRIRFRILVEVVIDEGPVKWSIKPYENDFFSCCAHLSQPLLKLKHRQCWGESFAFELAKVKTSYGHRLRIALRAIWLKLKIDPPASQ